MFRLRTRNWHIVRKRPTTLLDGAADHHSALETTFAGLLLLIHTSTKDDTRLRSSCSIVASYTLKLTEDHHALFQLHHIRHLRYSRLYQPGDTLQKTVLTLTYLCFMTLLVY